MNVLVVDGKELIQCPTCGKWLDRGKFNKNARAPLGLQTRCRECTKPHARVCQECGASFRCTTEQLRIGTGLYCSHYCSSRNKQPVQGKNYDYQTESIKLTTALIRKNPSLRPNKCPNCGQIGNIRAHHDDYAKPLEIRWMCQTCHMKVHRGEPVNSPIVRLEV